jgi:hypothetical protein
MITNLPDELLKLVVNNLTYHSRRILSRVCRRFGLLSLDNYSKFKVSIPGISKQLQEEIINLAEVTENSDKIAVITNDRLLSSNIGFRRPIDTALVAMVDLMGINTKIWNFEYFCYYEPGENIILKCKIKKDNIRPYSRRINFRKHSLALYKEGYIMNIVVLTRKVSIQQLIMKFQESTMNFFS